MNKPLNTKPKATLNIHNGPFKLRGNLPFQEPIWQKKWETWKVVSKLAQENRKKLIFHSGPPYANGEIHIGHALNMILKDFVFRYQAFCGNYCEFIPGWDTHGLPIALKVSEKNAWTLTKINHDPEKFRNQCRNHALKFVTKQANDFKRLGILTDFSKRYLTLTSDYVANQLKLFSKIVAKGLIFQSLKPVHWSWASETALADFEIIYQEKKSHSLWISFPIEANQTITKQFPNAKFLVWTTTPWTVPENHYLAIKAEEVYAVIKKTEDSDPIILAESLIPTVVHAMNWPEIKKIAIVSGNDLVNLRYKHPYLPKRTGTVLAGTHVTLTEGSGIVHIAPAFGVDDYYLVKTTTNTEIVCPIDNRGYFDHQATDQTLVGKFYQATESEIIQKITQAGNLEYTEIITHAFPHDWRTKKPLIFRATKQWYLNVKELQPQIQALIQKIIWVPGNTQKRMQNIIQTRTDWCLSRQRTWGVPIPVFYQASGASVLEPELIDHIAKQIEIHHNDNQWWTQSVSELLPKEMIEKYQIVAKGNDTFDVWFDSGISSYLNYPEQTIDLIWEGNDQFRGWFNSLMIINAIFDSEPKVRQILTHGFVNDSEGKKMSKSVGNVLDPKTIWTKFGAELLRIWILKTNYFADSNAGLTLFKELQTEYVKIRNTFRFLINNLWDYSWSNSENFSKHWTSLEHFIQLKITTLMVPMEKNPEQYQFNRCFWNFMNFIKNDLSNNYFYYAKGILYGTKSHQRRKIIQSCLAMVYRQLLPILSIFCPHTGEELYQITKQTTEPTSIFLTKFPQKNQTELSPTDQAIIWLKWHFWQYLKTAIGKITNDLSDFNSEWTRIEIMLGKELWLSNHWKYDAKKNKWSVNLTIFVGSPIEQFFTLPTLTDIWVSELKLKIDAKFIKIKINDVMNELTKQSFAAESPESNFLRVKTITIKINPEENSRVKLSKFTTSEISQYCRICRLRLVQAEQLTCQLCHEVLD